MNNQQTLTRIRAVIGLGNPGKRFVFTRHNIGFLVVDYLAQQHGATFVTEGPMEIAQVTIDGKKIFLVKPQTFMNNSGAVIPLLRKKGIQPAEILVIHDELEKKFGKIGLKLKGSARGHNGLKSIIEYMGDEFPRLWCGIDRPAEREQVSDYVLESFSEGQAAVDQMVSDAAQLAVTTM